MSESKVKASGGTPDRLRVVFCLDSLVNGGTELNAVRLAERLDKSRIDLRLVTFRSDGPLRTRYERAGVPIVPFPLRSFYGFSTLRQLARLVGYLRRERIDVLHSHDMYSSIVATVAARLARRPVTIVSRRWWGFDRRDHAVANAIAYRLADCVLANGETVAAQLEREGVKREKIAVVRNFVDESAFEPRPVADVRRMRAELGVPDDALLVGIIASLFPVKDHATLLRAAALLRPSHPNLHLVLVGEGYVQPALEHLTSELGIADMVHFTGYRVDAGKLHAAFDVSVLCSVSEGFPNTLVEAMAAGKPVVCTDVGSCREAVLDGVTGFVVPPSRPDAFAERLAKLLDDPDLRARMGAAGRERARSRHHGQQVLSALEALYGALLTQEWAGGAPSQATDAARTPAATNVAPLARVP
ncbi:MAG TPA: glycosyltransferase [Gemmatimonadaceae bacterium]|nr:glycosyltransferase [Gemmatimonadaceae bacterium]